MIRWLARHRWRIALVTIRALGPIVTVAGLVWLSWLGLQALAGP